MNVQELSVEPYTHHKELNPLLWQGNKLHADIRSKLLEIARHFVEYLNTPLQIKDITFSGSNASYGYSEYSDIDLHIVADVTADQEELFSAKKNQYNSTYDIKVKGVPVELYVQAADQVHHSAGIYSVQRNKWISEPSNHAPKASPKEVKSKARNYAGKINHALRGKDLDLARDTMDELRRLRKAGLEQGGEHSVENLAFKLLRSRGQIEKLRKYIDKLISAKLSLGEHNED
jgi:hypothetical protein